MEGLLVGGLNVGLGLESLLLGDAAGRDRCAAGEGDAAGRGLLLAFERGDGREVCSPQADPDPGPNMKPAP